MAFIDEIIARIPENGTGDITATDLQECFSIINDRSGKLGKVIEGQVGLEKTGYRLYEDAETYNYTGDTGTGAVDISYQNTVSNINGALGDYSFAAGQGTRTSTEGATVLGNFNIGATDSIFEVGIGTDDITRTNALTVKNDGTVSAPNLSVALIEAGDTNTLVTKEYTDALTFSVEEDHIAAAEGQTVFNFFQKASYVQVFGDGIKQSLTDPNNALTSIAIDNEGNGGTGLITVTFAVGQSNGTYIEVACFN